MLVLIGEGYLPVESGEPQRVTVTVTWALVESAQRRRIRLEERIVVEGVGSGE